MFNGTRQSCPLSPLLFVICLEPLATAIRLHLDVKEEKTRQQKFKLSIFVDDILLTLTDPHTTLPVLHNILRSFSDLSGYKMNTTKTEALPLNIPSSQLTRLQHNYAYHWCTQAIKYLGTYIISEYTHLYSANFPPLFKEIRSLIYQWNTHDISFLGSINILKMSILPTLLYLFEILPVAIPRIHQKFATSFFFCFIWRNKKPRIGRSVLLSARYRGGLGPQDITKYFLASHLRQTLPWMTRLPRTRWTEIELSQIYPIHLSSLLHSTDLPIRTSTPINLLNCMTFTRKVWRECNKAFDLISSCSYLTNVLYNPAIPDSLSHTYMLPWAQADIFQLQHLVNPTTHKLLSFEHLRDQNDTLPPHSFYAYLQFRHSFHTLKPP